MWQTKLIETQHRIQSSTDVLAKFGVRSTYSPLNTIVWLEATIKFPAGDFSDFAEIWRRRYRGRTVIENSKSTDLEIQDGIAEMWCISALQLRRGFNK